MPTFDSRGPIAVNLEVGLGEIRLLATDRTDTVVDVRPADPAKKGDVSAAQQTARSTGSEPDPASDASGTQAAAVSVGRPGSRPGASRRPSPGSRRGPQTKQVANGWSTAPAYVSAADSAAAHGTGSGAGTSNGDGTRFTVATRTSPDHALSPPSAPACT